jgi:p-aminobenzoyl-glutamate transporter AbgT
MTTVITIFIIIYAVSVAFMATVVTINKAWDEDKNYLVLVVFAPVINTLVFCVGIFYVVPSDIYEQHKDKVKRQHKHDPRWNLMNTRKND